jgi:hypothetical protein
MADLPRGSWYVLRTARHDYRPSIALFASKHGEPWYRSQVFREPCPTKLGRHPVNSRLSTITSHLPAVAHSSSVVGFLSWLSVIAVGLAGVAS